VIVAEREGSTDPETMLWLLGVTARVALSTVRVPLT
jgi:hypothetical protein